MESIEVDVQEAEDVAAEEAAEEAIDRDELEDYEQRYSVTPYLRAVNLLSQLHEDSRSHLRLCTMSIEGSQEIACRCTRRVLAVPAPAASALGSRAPEWLDEPASNAAGWIRSRHVRLTKRFVPIRQSKILAWLPCLPASGSQCCQTELLVGPVPTWLEVPIDMALPCQILAAATVLGCVSRRLLKNSLGDIMAQPWHSPFLADGRAEPVHPHLEQ